MVFKQCYELVCDLFQQVCNNLIFLRENCGCKTLQRLVVEQSKQSDYIFNEVHLCCKQRYHPPCSIRTFLMVTRLHIPACFLFLWHNSSPQIPHKLFFSCTLSESLPWLPFSVKRRKGKVKVILIGYFNDCLFTETSTVPDQAD